MNAAEINMEIDRIINKGYCYYTLEQAYSSLRKIKPYISYQDYWNIMVELNHKRLGKGADKLVEVCKLIIHRMGD